MALFYPHYCFYLFPETTGFYVRMFFFIFSGVLCLFFGYKFQWVQLLLNLGRWSSGKTDGNHFSRTGI